MEFTDLSLSRGLYEYHDQDGKIISSLPEKVGLPPLKRKWNTSYSQPSAPSVDLHLQTPLPSDWEQCLDLQSGRMYYVNRETSRKSWNRPMEKGKEKVVDELDLELNMMSGQNESSNNVMMAIACSNCHLLVILCRSSPSCPNCKFLHSV